jgi:GDP-L-fucose synthase
MFWKGKRVLVAGGTGMVGIPLVRLLLEQGALVRIASLDDRSRAHPDAEFLSLDLTTVENCRKACHGTEFVFNLLGVKASPAVTMAKPATHYYSTIMLEHCMLEAARLEGVEGFQFTSSVGVYEPAEVFYEDSVWKTFPSPNDWYAGWAKRAGELQVEAYAKEYKWKNLTIVRPANIYGLWDNFDSENAMVIPSLIKRALTGGPELVVWGDGSPIRDFIYSGDVARGMMIIAEKNPDEPINLGSGSGYTIKHLVDCIISNMPKPPKVVWDATKPNGDLKRIMDTARAKKYGFETETSLEKGVKEVMAWYEAHKDVTNSRYDIFDQKRS